MANLTFAQMGSWELPMALKDVLLWGVLFGSPVIGFAILLLLSVRRKLRFSRPLKKVFEGVETVAFVKPNPVFGLRMRFCALGIRHKMLTGRLF